MRLDSDALCGFPDCILSTARPQRSFRMWTHELFENNCDGLCSLLECIRTHIARSVRDDYDESWAHAQREICRISFACGSWHPKCECVRHTVHVLNIRFIGTRALGQIAATNCVCLRHCRETKIVCAGISRSLPQRLFALCLRLIC